MELTAEFLSFDVIDAGQWGEIYKSLDSYQRLCRRIFGWSNNQKSDLSVEEAWEDMIRMFSGEPTTVP